MKAMLVLASLLAALFLFACPAEGPPLSSAKDLVSVAFLKSANPGLSGNYVASWDGDQGAWVTAPFLEADNLLRSSLKLTFTISSGAIAWVNGERFYSGASAADFRGAVTLTVEAQDGSRDDYVVLTEIILPDPPADKVRTTFACYNAEIFENGDVQSADVHADIAYLLKTASVEVAMFSEISAATNDDVDILKTRLSEIGWEMPYDVRGDVSSGSFPFLHQDLAIISKYPLSANGLILLPAENSYLWPRSSLKADVTVNGTTVTLVVSHLKAMDDPTSLQKRINQASAMASWARSTYPTTIGTRPIIFAGDMNTVSAGDRGSNAATMGYLQLLDNNPGTTTDDFWAANESVLPTISTHVMGSVLDHIILSPGAEAMYVAGSAEVIKAAPGFDLERLETLSDHYMVLIELDI